jgi:hypothetical protein
MKTWHQELEKVDRLVDRRGKRVDAGIRETVAILKCAGFDTQASCVGHFDSRLKAPWVDLAFVPEEVKRSLRPARNAQREQNVSQHLVEQLKEAKARLLAGEARLLDLLDEFYRNRTAPAQRRLILKFYPGSARLLSRGAEVQDLYPPDIQQDKLREFQEEMAAFTEFLKQKFM